MEYWILFGSFAALLLIGTPVAFCLGAASFATVAYLGLPPVVVFQRVHADYQLKSAAFSASTT